MNSHGGEQGVEKVSGFRSCFELIAFGIEFLSFEDAFGSGSMVIIVFPFLAMAWYFGIKS